MASMTEAEMFAAVALMSDSDSDDDGGPQSKAKVQPADEDAQQEISEIYL